MLIQVYPLWKEFNSLCSPHANIEIIFLTLKGKITFQNFVVNRHWNDEYNFYLKVDWWKNVGIINQIIIDWGANILIVVVVVVVVEVLFLFLPIITSNRICV